MAKNSRYKKKNSRFGKKNEKGLSAIITTVILIAISMAAVVLVWVFVNNMIKKQINSSESCFGNYNKITLNPQYTCYDETDSSNYSLRFSLSIGDVKVDKVVVSVSSASAVKSYTITNAAQFVNGLKMYPSGISLVNLSEMNGGLTYEAFEFGSKIDSIKIAPVISGTQCDVSDSIAEIEDCTLMV
jgi:hypothetical protein